MTCNFLAHGCPVIHLLLTLLGGVCLKARDQVPISVRHVIVRLGDDLETRRAAAEQRSTPRFLRLGVQFPCQDDVSIPRAREACNSPGIIQTTDVKLHIFLPPDTDSN